jgi:hypothetical protein
MNVTMSIRTNKETKRKRAQINVTGALAPITTTFSLSLFRNGGVKYNAKESNNNHQSSTRISYVDALSVSVSQWRRLPLHKTSQEYSHRVKHNAKESNNNHTRVLVSRQTQCKRT